MDIREVIGRAMADAAEQEPKILPEAAIMRMRELAAAYAEQLKGPRFKIGDLVTPVQGSVVKGAGEPHIVVELCSGGPNFNVGEVFTTEFGSRCDTRVLSIGRGSFVVAHWVESYALELWKPEGKK